MNILFISKYPPIEGGVASRNYWLTRALGARGINIHVITNALAVEEMWREELDLSDPRVMERFKPDHVHIHSLKIDPPHHIPYSQAYLSRMVNLGLKIIGEHGADLIDAHYLEPYGTAGFVIKQITGLPLIIKHAGSDMYRLFQHKEFRYFLGRVLQGADGLFLSKSLYPLARELDINPKKLISLAKRPIDDSVFTPHAVPFDFSEKNITIPKEIPIITYMGKANTNKGISEVIRSLSRINKDFRLLFVSKGKKLNDFKEEIRSLGLEDKVIYLDFVPPWVVPRILRSTSALLHLENDFPIPIHSPIQPFEAIASQTPLILSREIFDKIKSSFPANAEHFNVVEKISDQDELTRMFLRIFDSSHALQENAKTIREEFLQRNDWDAYIDSYIAMYESFVR